MPGFFVWWFPVFCCCVLVLFFVEINIEHTYSTLFMLVNLFHCLPIFTHILLFFFVEVGELRIFAVCFRAVRGTQDVVGVEGALEINLHKIHGCNQWEWAGPKVLSCKQEIMMRHRKKSSA